MSEKQSAFPSKSMTLSLSQSLSPSGTPQVIALLPFTMTTDTTVPASEAINVLVAYLEDVVKSRRT